MFVESKKPKTLKIYSDGSSKVNEQIGTWCVILQCDGVEKMVYGIEKGKKVNSSRMELIGLSKIIPQMLIKGARVIEVYTDSEYINLNLKYYARKREKRDMDLWIPIHSALRKYKPKLRIRWIYGKEKRTIEEHIRCHNKCSKLYLEA